MTDRTLQAVTAQLAAMGCPSFEIGVRDAGSGKMMNIDWSRDEVIAKIRWLKHMNVKGNDVYVRPKAQWHHLILVDDLTRDALERMRRGGVNPALVVETSPANYQAWISVTQPDRKIVAPEIRGAIARRLAREYDADANSADARHYGRLAGFTNRKEKYRTSEGRQPWVLLREHGGQVAAAAADLVAAAEASLQEQEKQQEQQEQVRQAQVQQIAVRAREGDLKDPVAEFSSEMRGLLNRFGEQIADPANPKWTMSKCDFVVAAKMFRRGHETDAIELAMREASPDLDRRKAGHVDDYVQRTVRAAAAAVSREGAASVKSREVQPELVTHVDLDSFFAATTGGSRPTTNS